MRSILLFVFLFLSYSILSQSVLISGLSPYFSNSKVQVFKLTNAINNSQELIIHDSIDSMGIFNLPFELNQPEEILLQIDLHTLTIPIHPGTEIHLEISAPKNTNNLKSAIPYHITYKKYPKNTAQELVYRELTYDFANLQLETSKQSNLDQVYTDFFVKKDSVYSKYLTNDALFQTYYFNLKGLAFLRTDRNRKSIISEYVDTQKVKYKSDEYLKLLRGSVIPEIHGRLTNAPVELEKIKSEFKIHDHLIQFLLQDSICSSKEVLNLSVLLYIHQSASNSLFSFEQKQAIMGQIANFSNYPNQKLAAISFRKTKKKLAPHAEAPIFSLRDVYGQEITLQNYRGKNLYFGFIHTASPTCQKDMMVIEQQRKKFKKMHFLLIVVDRDTSQMAALIDEGSNLDIVYLNRNYSLLEEYEVYNFPTYYLVDKHGYFVNCPGKRPEEMYSVYSAMFDRKRGRKRYEIIND